MGRDQIGQRGIKPLALAHAHHQALIGTKRPVLGGDLGGGALLAFLGHDSLDRPFTFVERALLRRHQILRRLAGRLCVAAAKREVDPQRREGCVDLVEAGGHEAPEGKDASLAGARRPLAILEVGREAQRPLLGLAGDAAARARPEQCGLGPTVLVAIDVVRREGGEQVELELHSVSPAAASSRSAWK